MSILTGNNGLSETHNSLRDTPEGDHGLIIKIKYETEKNINQKDFAKKVSLVM